MLKETETEKKLNAFVVIIFINDGISIGVGAVLPPPLATPMTR